MDNVAGQARIRISDSGSGIEPEFLPQVFNRFAQEDGSTVRRHGGLGLGLAIVRHLVEAHGGTIRGESAGRGKGAAFSVLLPLMRAPEEAFEEEASALEGPTPKDPLKMASGQGVLNDLRILVVDDDLGTREAVAEMLGAAGAEVRVAASASEAITAVEKFRPEVLLCDIAMPGEDGYSLIRRVRAQGNKIPAAAVTALAGEENRVRAISAGFQMHLVKPVDIDHLTQAVAELSHRTHGQPVH